MIKEIADRKPSGKKRLPAMLWLFSASFLLYSLVSPGNLPGDTEARWSVSRQIVRGNGVSLEDSYLTKNCAVGVGGKRFSFYGLGQSICMLPFAAITVFLEKAANLDPITADLAGQFLVSLLLFPAIGAMLVCVFYRVLLLLGYNEKVTILLSSLFAFGTMIIQYSSNAQEQTQVGLLLVLAILFMVKYLQQRSFVYQWLFCVALGMCLIFRLASVVMIFPLYMVAVISDILKSDRKMLCRLVSKWFLAGILGTGLFVIFCGWYNYIRFGSIFESGYGIANAALGDHQMFRCEIISTISAMLFSPAKSIFLYNPILILLPFSLWSFVRKHKTIGAMICVAVVGNFVFYSLFAAWAGDYAWSIRYQVPVLPFLILPLATFFTGTHKIFIKIPVILIIIASILIQLSSVVYNFNLEFVQNPNHCLIPDDYVWDWQQSHLNMRIENIIRHISNRRQFSSVKVTQEDPQILKQNYSEETVRYTYNVNFFPLKAASRLPSVRLRLLLSCIWFVLLLSFCLVTFKLIRFYKNCIVA